MTRDEHVSRLKKDVGAWNEWRRRNPSVRYVDLSGADLYRTNLRGADLSVANLRGAHLSGADLQNTDLDAADLSRADLSRANLERANLERANLRAADLNGTNLNGTNLSDAILSDAILRGTNFIKANLRGANFSGADLQWADLGGTDLQWADLGGANLNRTSLVRADLNRANLNRADLRGANLRGAHLNGTILSGANLDGAIFYETNLGEVNFEKAIGLDNCKHLGPSNIDFRTLSLSKNLPISFLRGCGLPDVLIEYLPSLRGDVFDFYSCFISYSSKDQMFAERLHADLQNAGVRCWFAPHHLSTGAKIWDAIDEAIKLRDKLLVILSAASLGSDWVEDEVNKAYAEERDRKTTVLFPIRIDDLVMATRKPWARKLRDQRHIGDFREWESAAQYSKSLERLLRDLKAAAT